MLMLSSITDTMLGKSYFAVVMMAAQALPVFGATREREMVKVTVSETVRGGELANIHLDWLGQPPTLIKSVYAPCDNEHSLAKEQIIGQFSFHGRPPQRLVWVVPDEAPTHHCVYIYGSGGPNMTQRVLGKSSPVSLQKKPRKRSTADTIPLLKDFDAQGAWFDGVAKIKDKVESSGGVASKGSPKNTSIAIVGGGISGLATGLMLDSVGIHNWEIIEASDRVGGRFRTKYVADTQEWAEMGPMRLPYSVTYRDDNETLLYSDHQLTFQMANILNNMNKNDSQWRIDFIPWIQHSPNELYAQGTRRHPDGRIPTRAEIEEDPSLKDASEMTSAEYSKTEDQMNKILKDEKTLKSLQKDVWRAHKTAMDQGLDDWSEQAMMRHVFKASQNITDEIWTSSDYDVFWDELHHNSNLGLDGSKDSLGETKWLCIDRGFNRLSEAFLPHVRDRLTLNRKVRKLESVKGSDSHTRTRLSWYPNVSNRTFESKEYDYTIMAAPFTMTRFMDLPKFSSVLDRAISEAGLRFKSACKVALLFSERFWEKGDRPIFGGYSKPLSDSVGALYYPVYGLNESRPGLIMHYRGGDWSDRFVSFSDEEHVQTVLDSIVSLHGEQARDLYTGDYERLCWLQDEYTATSWCRPDVAQHQLYIPAYHQTEHNTIFIGEHTAPTQAWVSSSLHSSVRGSVQLLLELGLVDEAKELNQRWMGRWIKL
ncbi:Amine oxidase [Penicillium roqueforti FM164]|uniref:Amine oxidase n=1 Tax=Penicillium roqueforti (strain FM164) TaxID=1365484 RepID=W6QM83_PENRF|nr:Amine oxidase [Penicillium roqueforti FM164]